MTYTYDVEAQSRSSSTPFYTLQTGDLVRIDSGATLTETGTYGFGLQANAQVIINGSLVTPYIVTSADGAAHQIN